ncbi:MAG TPA: HEPN domain-containing protein [Hymenobacter sp.]|uniref:HEPN domain-containing protein n=1 Tax=Hymenobacter sp. TaxID=1898978 RepID=UPI002D810B96|nr:HEPN domain-containing protein [Hymenobacter sp.]HET9504738.1 HEPN domain-containing protein [Hymenobacter sp.]
MQPSSSVQQRVATMLRAADRDMEAANSLMQNSPHLYESIGFSCQQAVEKYIKAVLIASGLPAPFIHVLVKLLLPLTQAGIVVLSTAEMDNAAALQDFAVTWRYETDDAPSFISADLVAMADRFRTKLRPLAQAFLI